MRSRIGLTCVFQSTLPLRGATSVEKILPGLKNISIHVPLAGSDQQGRDRRHRADISIHAPLAGSDRSRRGYPRRGHYFNPRSPCRERHALSFLPSMMVTFQSTLPLRGATPG